MPASRRPRRGETPAERAVARRALGSLNDLLVSPRMQVRYRRAVSYFVHVLSLLFVCVSDDLPTLDRQLCYFLELCWQEGESKATVADAICGIQHSLNVRRCFPGAWRLFGSWTRAEIPFRAAPLPLFGCFGLSGALISLNELGAAALVCCGFNCILRTGELLSMCRNHIQWAADGRSGVIVLPWTKSGQRAGCTESVAFSDPVVCNLLLAACRVVGSHDPIFQGSGTRFRGLFDAALRLCGLQGLDFRPYSLRRGGATNDYMEHLSVANTQIRGRWQSLRACRIYITEGQEAISRQAVNQGAMDNCRHFAEFLRRFL